MKEVIKILIMLITFIPILLCGLLYQITYVIFMELGLFVARVTDWAGDPKTALEYVKLIKKVNK